MVADEEVEILKQFVAGGNSSFHLIAFKSKYLPITAYAFIDNDSVKFNENKPAQAVFGCMPKKAVKSIAENYMDEMTYNDWFGARLKVV